MRKVGTKQNKNVFATESTDTHHTIFQNFGSETSVAVYFKIISLKT